jgi:hypothetical protein
MKGQQPMSDTFSCPRRAETGFAGEDSFRADGTCSYCGSMSPDKLFEAIEAGAEIGPTDKNYKVYVESDEGHGKAYFQHLGEDEKRRFIDLLNANKIRIGYPHHFYVRPFFIAPPTAQPAA